MPKIADVAANKDGVFSNYPGLVAVATNLNAENTAFAAYAAQAASDLFSKQEELGLTNEDQKAAFAKIADERQVMLDNNQAAFDIFAKNWKAPEPPAPAAPAADNPAE